MWGKKKKKKTMGEKKEDLGARTRTLKGWPKKRKKGTKRQKSAKRVKKILKKTFRPKHWGA